MNEAKPFGALNLNPLDYESKWLEETPRFKKSRPAESEDVRDARSRFWHLKGLPKSNLDPDSREQVEQLERKWRSLLGIDAAVKKVLAEFDTSIEALEARRAAELTAGGDLGTFMSATHGLSLQSILEKSKDAVQECLVRHAEKCVHLDSDAKHVLSWFDALLDEQAQDIPPASSNLLKSFDQGMSLQAELAETIEKTHSKLATNHDALRKFINSLVEMNQQRNEQIKVDVEENEKLKARVVELESTVEKLSVDLKASHEELRAAEEQVFILGRKLKAHGQLLYVSKRNISMEMASVQEELSRTKLDASRRESDLRHQLSAEKFRVAGLKQKSEEYQQLETRKAAEHMRKLVKEKESLLAEERRRFEIAYEKLQLELVAAEKKASQERARAASYQHELERMRGGSSSKGRKTGKSRFSSRRPGDLGHSIQNALNSSDPDLARAFSMYRDYLEQQLEANREEKDKSDTESWRSFKSSARLHADQSMAIDRLKAEFSDRLANLEAEQRQKEIRANQQIRSVESKAAAAASMKDAVIKAQANEILVLNAKIEEQSKQLEEIQTALNGQILEFSNKLKAKDHSLIDSRSKIVSIQKEHAAAISSVKELEASRLKNVLQDTTLAHQETLEMERERQIEQLKRLEADISIAIDSQNAFREARDRHKEELSLLKKQQFRAESEMLEGTSSILHTRDQDIIHSLQDEITELKVQLAALKLERRRNSDFDASDRNDTRAPLSALSESHSYEKSLELDAGEGAVFMGRQDDAESPSIKRLMEDGADASSNIGASIVDQAVNSSEIHCKKQVERNQSTPEDNTDSREYQHEEVMIRDAFLVNQGAYEDVAPTEIDDSSSFSWLDDDEGQQRVVNILELAQRELELTHVDLSANFLQVEEQESDRPSVQEASAHPADSAVLSSVATELDKLRTELTRISSRIEGATEEKQQLQDILKNTLEMLSVTQSDLDRVLDNIGSESKSPQDGRVNCKNASGGRSPIGQDEVRVRFADEKSDGDRRLNGVRGGDSSKSSTVAQPPMAKKKRMTLRGNPSMDPNLSRTKELQDTSSHQSTLSRPTDSLVHSKSDWSTAKRGTSRKGGTILRALTGALTRLVQVRRNMKHTVTAKAAKDVIQNDQRLQKKKAATTFKKLEQLSLLKNISDEYVAASLSENSSTNVDHLKRLVDHQEAEVSKWEIRRQEILAEQQANWKRALAALGTYAESEDHYSGMNSLLEYSMSSSRPTSAHTVRYELPTRASIPAATCELDLVPSFSVAALSPRPQPKWPPSWHMDNSLLQQLHAPSENQPSERMMSTKELAEEEAEAVRALYNAVHTYPMEMDVPGPVSQSCEVKLQRGMQGKAFYPHRPKSAIPARPKRRSVRGSAKARPRSAILRPSSPATSGYHRPPSAPLRSVVTGTLPSPRVASRWNR